MDKDMKRSLSHGLRPPRRQRGAVMVLVAAGMLAIVAMAGLALDLGDSYLSKTRLQNALDASALSGAKTLDGGSTAAQAQTAAENTFNQHPDVTGAGLPVIEFSATLVPFTPGATEPAAKFVRSSVASYPRNVWFAAVLGITDRAVAGTAVAGPSPICPPPTPPAPPICDLAPMMMCGDSTDPDTDCSDGACYGYNPATTGNPEITLKTHSGGHNDWEVGPGNFQLIQLDCGPGGACVRDAMAGGSQCLSNADTVTTKPGNTVGPVAQGFNTRFNDYQGPVSPAQYPPDTVTFYDTNASETSLNTFWYSDYQVYNPPDVTPVDQGGIGVPERRILAVPIGDCTGTTNGQGDVSVLGFGCFFMTRPTEHKGNTQEIYGELISECEASGPSPGPGPAPCTTSTPFVKIVLFKDPDGTDS